MRKQEGRSRSVTGRVTPSEKGQIEAKAVALGMDVSGFVREACLREVADGALSTAQRPAWVLLEAWVRTYEAEIEVGRRLTRKEFRQICAEVKGSCDGSG